MNDKDLRDCFAMFALCGAIMNGNSWTPKDIWEIADSMVEDRDKEDSVGLPPIKSRKAKTK